MVFRDVNSSGNGGHDVKTMALNLLCSLLQEEGDEGIQKRGMWSISPDAMLRRQVVLFFLWRSLGPKLRLGVTKPRGGYRIYPST